MAYPDDLLSPGEHVVIHQHPHWKVLVGPVLALVVAVGGGVCVGTLASGLGPVAWVASSAVVAVLVAWLTVAPVLRWGTTHFVVTDERVMYRIGVVKRTDLTIPLNRVDGVRFEHGLVDRLLGCGTLVVEPASAERLEFDDVARVEQVRSALYREINDKPADDHRPEDRVADGRA